MAIEPLIDNLLFEKFSKPKQFCFALILLSFAVFYLSAAISDDEFAGRYTPTLFYHLSIRGFSRKISDFASFCAFCFCLVIQLLYFKTSLDTNAFKLFKSLKNGIVPDGIKVRQAKVLQKKLFVVIKLCLVLRNLAIFVLGSSILLSLKSRYSFLSLILSLLIIAIIRPLYALLLPPIAQIYVTSLYFSYRIQNFRLFLKFRTVLKNLNPQQFKQILIRHNRICEEIANYNSFWKNFYFAALVSMTPINLFMLHGFLFEVNLQIFLFLALIVALLISGFYVFFVGFCFALISYKVHKTKPQLNSLIYKTNYISFRTWLNLMNCVERMSCRDKKIGFTCLTLFTVTSASLFKVINYY